MPGERSNDVRGAVAWMVAALIAFSVLAVAAREVSSQVPPIQLVFWRAFVALTILAIVIGVTGRRDLKSKQPVLQCTRSIIHFGAQYGWFYALGVISMVELFTLEFTTPLWIAVLAPFLLGERLSAYRLMGALVGFAGAVIVVWPWGAAGGSWQVSHGSLVALAAALGYAFNLMAVKRLTKTDSPITILLWINGVHVVFGSLFLLPGVAWPNLAGWLLVILIGACGLFAHYCISRAFALADAVLIAPIDFLRVPLIAVVGSLLYGESLGTAVLAGAVCILAGNAINLFGEYRARAIARARLP